MNCVWYAHARECAPSLGSGDTAIAAGSRKSIEREVLLSVMLERLSSVSVGRAYELLVLGVLRRYSFQLVHSGRPGDGGVDFIGHWSLPNTRVNIVGQCKHHQSPLGPRDVREFESVVRRMSRRRHTVAGVLVSCSGFSQQAMQTVLNSELPLICSQIRALVTNSDSFNDDITNNDNVPSSGGVTQTSLTRKQGELKQIASNSRVGTHMKTQQGSSETNSTSRKLIDHGYPLSQLGSTLWGNEENKVKCLRKRGYFTRSLPPELSCGYINDFVMNPAMKSLCPSVKVVWRYDMEVEGRKGILVLFQCPVNGCVYDLGAVSRRHFGSGEPTAWHYHSSVTSL